MKFFALALSATVAAGAAPAQSMPECKGHFEVIRMDTIKPGKMDEFRKAVRDHQAWYKAHGTDDKIVLARIIAQGEAPAYAADQVMTIHVETPKTPGAVDESEHDAAWNAIVAEYKDSSTVTSTTIACVEGN